MIPAFLIDELIAVSVLITSSLLFRFVLQFVGQQWVKTFAHTLTIITLPLITFVITRVIAGDIALSLGMVGALSIVRFRHPVRSPLELAVYFASITLGIAGAVNVNWVLFLDCVLFGSFGLVFLISLFTNTIFKFQFTTSSFSEGHQLSTLSITSGEEIPNLSNHPAIKSVSNDGNSVSYYLASNDFSKLSEILDSLQTDNRVFQYNLSK